MQYSFLYRITPLSPYFCTFIMILFNLNHTPLTFTGCVCDPTYGEIDCSSRMCPYGNDVLDTRDNLLVSAKFQVQVIYKGFVLIFILYFCLIFEFCAGLLNREIDFDFF
jgi:hypothetical protein